MNFILIFLFISTFVDWYYEDENNWLKTTKFGLSFLSLIPVLISIYESLLFYNSIIVIILRATFCSIFPNFYDRCCEYKMNNFKDRLRESYNKKRKSFYRFFICSSENGDPSMNYYNGFYINPISNYSSYEDIYIQNYNIFSFYREGSMDSDYVKFMRNEIGIETSDFVILLMIL